MVLIIKQFNLGYGHSTASTTMNIYSHVDSSVNQVSANVIANVFSPVKA